MKENTSNNPDTNTQQRKPPLTPFGEKHGGLTGLTIILGVCGALTIFASQILASYSAPYWIDYATGVTSFAILVVAIASYMRVIYILKHPSASWVDFIFLITLIALLVLPFIALPLLISFAT